MVDNMSGGQMPITPAGPKPKSPIVAFLSSSTGRLIVGGIILFVVVVVAGTLAFYFLVNSAPPVPTSAPPTPGASKPATATAPPKRPPETGLKETFTFRDIFAPTVHPVTVTVASASSPSASSGTTNSTETSGTTSGQKDTLILKSIATDNGVRVATFEWNGTNYGCRAGDQVDESPWQVLTIYSDSVLMLYGDSQVTLTVGQGFAKSGSTSVSK